MQPSSQLQQKMLHFPTPVHDPNKDFLPQHSSTE